MSFKFKKIERLRHKKIINRLFDRNNEKIIRITEFPFVFVILELEKDNNSDTAAQILFNVPKKYNKKAVDRNRKRRQIKEIYRLRKHKIYKIIEQKNTKFAFMLVFLGRKDYTFQKLEEKFDKLIEKTEKVLLQKKI